MVKLGQKIKIVASNPVKGQYEITQLGEVETVVAHWKQKGNEDWNVGEVQVNSREFKGLIALNVNEYELIKE